MQVFKTGWKRKVVGIVAGLLLVGCSRLFAQHPPVPDAVPQGPDVATLSPGVLRVTVGRVATNSATIWWGSPWQGQSTVAYGRDPRLPQIAAEHTVPTADRTVALDSLEPDTRYFFQVETATPLGVARSAVLSFRTAPGPALTPLATP